MESSLPHMKGHLAPSTSDALRPTFRDIRALCRFSKTHEDMFRLAKDVPYWLQLLRSSPVLAFVVARCWHFDGLPQDGADARIRAYVRMKRIDICAAMGFPAYRWSVQIFSRMQIWSEEMVQILLLLRALLRWEPSARDIFDRKKRLGQFLGPTELKQLAIGERWGDFSLFENIDELAWFFQLPAAKRYWLADYYKRVALKNALNDVFLESVKPLASFRNERSAVSFITNYRKRGLVIWRATEQLEKRIKDFTWPEPPLPATDSILPILSNEALEKEGRNLRHCVATYGQRVLLGEYYVYRVEGSPRCTLGIQYVDGAWKIDQLKGERNEAPSDPGVFEKVNAWLLSASVEKRDTSSRMEYLKAISDITGFPVRRRR